MNYFFYGFIGYCVASITFFVFPYKKKKNKFTHPKYHKITQKKAILHISHRGGCRENLENTMDAFQHAYESGSNCLEMDVCMTKDNKIVVLHDSSLLRMCGVDGHVKDYNYSDLPKFLERVRLDFAPNDYISTSTCKTPNLPLFKDVLKRFPDVLINVEIKTPEPEVIEAVKQLIQKYNREETIIWGAKFQKYNSLLQKANPDIPRFFSAEQVLKTYLCYVTGLLPFVDIVDDSMQVPLYTDDFYHWKLQCSQSKLEAFSQIFFHNFIWVMGLISKPLYYHLSKRGVFVYYWVLNNEKEFDRALAAGCHGIMTDCPTQLKKYLVNKKLYEKL